MSKAYLNRNKEQNRPANDLYHTPFSLVWELLKYEHFLNCLEPCAGNGAIIKASKSIIKFKSIFDIAPQNKNIEKKNFFSLDKWEGNILTNPPFSKWNQFVMHAKLIGADRICMLGCTNYFGSVNRYTSHIWDNLQTIYIFNRYPDLRTPYREDGLFYVAGRQLAWFVWKRGWKKEPVIRLLDVQKYAKLGQYKG